MALLCDASFQVYDQYALSAEQVKAGEEIIKSFAEDSTNTRWIVLLAQMQSGKTETYLFVCCELLRLSIVNSVVIFSGNAETDLRDQLKKEVLGLGDAKFYGKYDLYLEENLGITSRQRREVLSLVKTNISVIWGTELNKIKKTYTKTLFIWEEAHHAQTIHQCPDKFLKKVGISADGDFDHLNEKGNFVVSISATPFSEISDIHYFEQQKKLVYMRPGVGYNSVKNILTSGRLKSFSSVESGLRTALATPHGSSKYAIVRISNKNEDTIKRVIGECGWNWVIFDSLSNGEAKDLGQKVWDGMKNAPERDIVILLRGKCRMGKNLEKEHVLFVMETAKSSNTDTVLQGLLGRVCGYSAGSDLVDVYLHQKIVKSGEIERYIDLTEGQHIIPAKACNIAKTSVIKTRHPIIPFMVSNVDSEGNSNKQIKSKIRKEISGNFDFGRTEPEQFYEIRDKFLDTKAISEKKIEIVIHDVTGNEQNRFEPVSKAIHHFKTTDDSLPVSLWHTGVEKVKKDGTRFEEGRIINVFYYKNNDERYGILAGSAFIYGVTEKKNSIYVSKTNIPKTTGREVFAHNLEDGTEVVSNGSFVIQMPLDTSKNVSIMKQWISDFVELSLRFPDSRSVHSQWDNKDKMYKGIVMVQEVERALLPGGEIYQEIQSKFGFRIDLAKSDQPLDQKIVALGYVRYASINW